ncbi:hypothetical protein MHYP_G00140670 [Metynnis hypsauchen]
MPGILWFRCPVLCGCQVVLGWEAGCSAAEPVWLVSLRISVRSSMPNQVSKGIRFSQSSEESTSAPASQPWTPQHLQIS